MPSLCSICFIVEETMSPPTSGDLNPAAAIVIVAAAIAVVSLSKAESCRCILMTQIRFVAVPIVMVAAQRCTEVFSCLPLNQLAMISFPFLARSLFAPDGSSHHAAKFNNADSLWQALARGGGYLKTCQNRRRRQLGKSMYQAPQRDPDAVDVNTVAVGEGSESPNWQEQQGGSSETERKKQQVTRK